MKKLLTVLSAIFLVVSTVSFADSIQLSSDDVVVKTPEVMVMGSDKASAVVSMTLDNKSNKMINIVAAHSDLALETQLHQTINGKMVQVKSIEIAPHGHDDLQKNGFHVMLLDIKSPLSIGQVIPITLILSDGSSVIVNAKVD